MLIWKSFWVKDIGIHYKDQVLKASTLGSPYIAWLCKIVYQLSNSLYTLCNNIAPSNKPWVQSLLPKKNVIAYNSRLMTFTLPNYNLSIVNLTTTSQSPVPPPLLFQHQSLIFQKKNIFLQASNIWYSWKVRVFTSILSICSSKSDYLALSKPGEEGYHHGVPCSIRDDIRARAEHCRENGIYIYMGKKRGIPVTRPRPAAAAAAAVARSQPLDNFVSSFCMMGRKKVGYIYFWSWIWYIEGSIYYVDGFFSYLNAALMFEWFL